MPQFTRFSYASTSTALPSTIREHLISLIHNAHTSTARGEMAGILIYGNNYFFHCIEAPASTVEDIYQNAIKNPLHTNFKLLKRELITTRWFTGWQIKYFRQEKVLEQFFIEYQQGQEFNPYILEGPILDEFLQLLVGQRRQPDNERVKINTLSGSSGRLTTPYYINFIMIAVLLMLLTYLIYYYQLWNGVNGTYQ